MKNAKITRMVERNGETTVYLEWPVGYEIEDFALWRLGRPRRVNMNKDARGGWVRLSGACRLGVGVEIKPLGFDLQHTLYVCACDEWYVEHNRGGSIEAARDAYVSERDFIGAACAALENIEWVGRVDKVYGLHTWNGMVGQFAHTCGGVGTHAKLDDEEKAELAKVLADVEKELA